MNKEKVYEFYKQFKYVPVDNKFILGSHTYKKISLTNTNGITHNAICIDSVQSPAYIVDFEWVVVID